MLAQALLGEPPLLLLDEPLISLDYRYQEAVIGLVRRLARERNITVLFSAHELNQLIGALDRVLYLGNGRAALGTSTKSSPGRCCRSSTARISTSCASRANFRALARPRATSSIQTMVTT